MNLYEIYLRVGSMSSVLENLVRLGARRLGVVSFPATGCCPVNRLQSNGTGDCMEEMNEYAELFFANLLGLSRKLISEVPGLQFSIGNTYLMTLSIINNPFVFRRFQRGGKSLLWELYTKCQNRKEYLFWDQYHPTQAGAELAALTLFTGSPPSVLPVNFSKLAQIYVYN
ncbi:GDSL esterase/lipase At3g53100-like [Punica granatum]|uniref:GDSL esterase/lipase At3g53100-like n=1 Tax=Punica granatum TaxID=22663 RepID=A0A6P8E756_PUNGR|nr:GDSL esterase/lipase At3g53100-like [Punica granatum]